MKRMLGLTMLTMAISSGVSGQEVEPPEKPDILLIVIDDLGCRDLGVEGHSRHLTPAIDACSASTIAMSMNILARCRTRADDGRSWRLRMFGQVRAQ